MRRKCCIHTGKSAAALAASSSFSLKLSRLAVEDWPGLREYASLWCSLVIVVLATAFARCLLSDSVALLCSSAEPGGVGEKEEGGSLSLDVSLALAHVASKSAAVC